MVILFLENYSGKKTTDHIRPPQVFAVERRTPLYGLLSAGRCGKQIHHIYIPAPLCYTDTIIIL